MKSLTIIYFLIALLDSALSFSQAGNLDPDFGGGDGLVTKSFFTNQPCEGYRIAVQEDGKILVAGYTRGAAGHEHAVLTRYLPDGTPDNSFNGNSQIIFSMDSTNSFSQAVITQADGKIIYIAIYYTSQETKLAVHRFLEDGSVDNSFDADGIATRLFDTPSLSVKSVAVQPDGKIVLGGYMDYPGESFGRFFVIRYLKDGALDDSFDGDGIDTLRVGENYSDVTSVLVQPDGKIIAAGYAVFNNNDDFAVVRYNTDGSRDHTFSDDGIAYATLSNGNDRSSGAVLQPDGKIVMGGYAYSSITGKSAFAAARFNEDGTLDSNFHGNGMNILTVSGYSDASRSILLQPDGKILLGGYAHSGLNGGADMALVRLNENGILDFTFDNDGMAIYEDDINTSSTVNAMAFQPDGKIVGTGYVRIDGLNSIRIARFISGLTVSTAGAYPQVKNVALFPNPVSEEIILNYNLDKTEKITIQLYDGQGRFVQSLLSSAERFPGQHSEKLTLTPGLPTGCYFVNMVSDYWSKSVQVVHE